MITQIKNKKWLLEDWLKRVAATHNAEIEHDCNENILSVDNERYKININAWFYPIGINFILVQMESTEDYYLQLHDNITEAPLVMTFMQQGSVDDEQNGDVIFSLDSGHSSISAAKTGTDRYFKVAKNQKQQFVLASIVRSEYLDFVNCALEELQPEIKKVIEDVKGELNFFLNMPYPASLSKEISSAFADQSKDLIRFSNMEAYAQRMIANQIEIYEKGALVSRVFTPPSNNLELMVKAHQLLIGDLSNPPSIPELAKTLGINRQKLKVGYKQFHGMTIMRHLRQFRMQKAYELLVTGDYSVAQVAELTGYTSRSHFAKRFRENFNQSPREVMNGKNIISG